MCGVSSVYIFAVRHISADLPQHDVELLIGHRPHIFEEQLAAICDHIRITRRYVNRGYTDATDSMHTSDTIWCVWMGMESHRAVIDRSAEYVLLARLIAPCLDRNPCS